ncbi:AraC family transcriptional regulator [Fontibacillus phaseoli]|uniref:AraC family transcriptional regulator n=1 Tax=Fontibacillus phaseoli TaxID=1416533 RepID=A0A369B3R9_9BACL|nr:AraC family transcriptional regulator [Fontibacillus phaseoli]RCX16202.1 AraC family transcriptional regulator [Fontibacillus phaseoli]
MNNFETIQQSIEYIESRLDEELTLKEVSQAMHYSEYHFHRTFLYMVGDTVTSYIRKRRLSKAAELLAFSNKKLLDIALECGFGSHEAFTRAFRKMYGILPSACRRLGRPPYIVAKAELQPLFDEKIYLERGEVNMEYRIETSQAMRVIGYGIQTTTVEGQNSTEIPAFWQAYMKDRLGEKVPGKKRPDVELGICTAMDEDGMFRYIIGFETDNVTEVPEGMVDYVIPEATYAIFTTPPVSQEDFTSSIQETWNQIFSEWFPSSGYEQACAPDFEWYDQRCWPKEGKQIDIYIPVQPAEAK